MYSDLLDALGGGGASAGGTSTNRRENDGKHVAVSMKAGKMDMALQENGKYWVSPDTRRGMIQLVWDTNQNSLNWEWMDRRAKTVVDQIPVTAGGGTFERIVDGPVTKDRVYLWQTPAGERTMYWMQDASEELEDEQVAQVNQYLANPADAKPTEEEGADADSTAAAGANSAGSRDPEAFRQIMEGVTSSSNNGATTTGTGGSSSQQVDALSNILENLGMPQRQPAATSSSTTAGTGDGTNNAAAPGGNLTLADLQGAMAGVSATGTTAAAGPPLQELVTPGAISSLLENKEVCDRLMALLPENQRSMEHLEANLRSPQVSQTLRSLTSALLPDDTGSLEGYHSVLANFQLSPEDGEASLKSGNPIQAFLDCVLASVEREQQGEDSKQEEETKEEGKDEPMEE